MCELKNKRNRKPSTQQLPRKGMIKSFVLRVISLECLCLIVLSFGFVASAQNEGLDSRVAQEFSITNAQVVDLDFIQTQQGIVEADIEIDGQQLTIEVQAHSVRSNNFVLMEQIEDGSLVERIAAPSRTCVGTLKGIKGSRVVGCMLDQGLAAKIVMGDGHVTVSYTHLTLPTTPYV